jgi:predicted GIY-YIG superfamily endonuclease
MYSTYVLLLEENRFYVGNTPTDRLTQRLLEHTSPKFPGSKWTSKYQVLRKGPVYHFKTFQESSHKEDALTEEIMKKYGLDSCRGGQWVMAKEGGTWWVPSRMRCVPRFTCEHTSLASAENASFHSEALCSV